MLLFAVACGGPQIKEPASADLSKMTPATLEAERPREGDPNIVEVYVGHLRRKVDRPFGRAAIETVRGAGYRLAADGG